MARLKMATSSYKKPVLRDLRDRGFWIFPDFFTHRNLAQLLLKKQVLRSCHAPVMPPCKG